MSLQLTDEQREVQRVAHDFAINYLASKAEELDENNRFPEETIPELAKLGFMGVAYPEQWNGGGWDSVTEAIIVEEVSYGCAATASILTAHYLGLDGIFLHGNDEQKKNYLAPACEGKKLAAFCLTEPGAGSDVSAALTTAVLDGDDYVLNGTKHFISNAAYADFLVVYAMTDKSLRNHGMSAFIVDKGTPGLSFGKGDNKMGIRGARTYEVIFDNCRIPKSHLLGKVGDGFKIAMQVIDRGRIGIASMAVGLAQAALDATVEYAKQRKVFGHTISEYQGIQWMIAEMATDVITARSITYSAAQLRDTGHRISTEAAAAKLFASEAAHRVVDKAVQIHGGYGYMKEFPVERFYRDQRILQIFEGTSEVQKMVISRQVIGR